MLHRAQTASDCILKEGFLEKKKLKTGIFTKRFVQIRNGWLMWYKHSIEDLIASYRFLPGSSIQLIESDPSTFLIVIQTAQPLFSSVNFRFHQRKDAESWINAMNHGSHWSHYRKYPFLDAPRIQLRGFIYIHLMSCENIKGADINGLSDPFVSFSFDFVQARSKTFYQTLKCEFNEYLKIPVFHDDPNWLLSFSVFDADVLFSSKLLGFGSVPLSALGMNEEKCWSLNVLSERADIECGYIKFRTLYISDTVLQMLPRSNKRNHPDCTAYPVYKFQMSVVKTQIERVKTVFAAIGEGVNAVKDFIQWRNPYLTVIGWFMLSYMLLLRSDLIIPLLVLGILAAIISSHPEFKTFLKKDFRFLFKQEEPPSPPTGTHRLTAPNILARRSQRVASPASKRPTNAEPDKPQHSASLSSETPKIILYEMQRRNISATATALLNRDIQLKQTFSYQNLRPAEPRWLTDTLQLSLILPMTIIDGYKYSWKIQVNQKSDNNGWQYGKRWPIDSSVDFRKDFRLHKDWVRRRMWVGTPIRQATLMETSETIDYHDEAEEEFDEGAVPTKATRSLLAKYRFLMDECGKIQYMVFTIVNSIEKSVYLYSWKNPSVTSFLLFGFFCIGICCSIVKSAIVLVWMGITAVLMAQFKKIFLPKYKFVSNFLTKFRLEISSDLKLSEQMRKQLSKIHFLTSMESLNDVHPEALRVLLQKTADNHNFHMKFSIKESANAKFIADYVYNVAHGIKMRDGNKLRSNKIEPDNFIANCAVDDWHLYNQYSNTKLN
jgi:C2 domain